MIPLAPNLRLNFCSLVLSFYFDTCAILKHGKVRFSSCHSLNAKIFCEVLIILKLDYFVIEVWHVVVVPIILTNNHFKFLTQMSIGLARLIEMLPTIIPMDSNTNSLAYTNFSITLNLF